MPGICSNCHLAKSEHAFVSSKMLNPCFPHWMHVIWVRLFNNLTLTQIQAIQFIDISDIMEFPKVTEFQVFLVWKHAKAKGSPEQIELSISVGVILFCWLLNGMYATAVALETQYFWEIYQKSRKVHLLTLKTVFKGPWAMNHRLWWLI